MRAVSHFARRSVPGGLASSCALCLAILLVLPTSSVRATFSIVAVDTATHVVGSAGASCIAGAQIIEDVVESLGAVNTQAMWNARNQSHADSLLRLGWSPASIVSWLSLHDAANDGFNAADRQYGVVTVAGPGASASYTGNSTLYWAGHRTGAGYAVQGNILLDSTVVAMMEEAFLNTPGPLEDRLMAALQAAKVPGADSRCLPLGKSTISAYIHVNRPGDGVQSYLDLVVPNTTGSTDPIDVLQTQYDAWREAQRADPLQSTTEISPAGIPTGGKDTAWITVTVRNSLNAPPTQGCSVSFGHTGQGTVLPPVALGDAVFRAGVMSGPAVQTDTVVASVEAGGQTVALQPPQTLYYFLCGDVNADGHHTSADIIGLVNYVFKSGPPPLPVPSCGDVNRSGSLTSADVIMLVNYVFKSGTPPCP